MTVRAADGKRLTWDAAVPAPFESGWAIFAKLAILNNLNLNELARLIQRDDAVGGAARAVDYSDSSWIDFSRFSGLLGVDERRLRTGFLDQLGIVPTFKNRYEIRHCPKCWDLGYHCAIFDLSALSSCPWHRCSLTNPCAGCAFPSTFALQTSHGMINSRFCARCGMTVPGFPHLLSTARISADYAAMIIGYCREFIDWWELIGQKIPHRDIVFRDILRIGNDPPHNPIHCSWQIGHAIAAVGENTLAWKFRWPPTEVKHASWTEGIEKTVVTERRAPARSFRIGDNAGKCYQSLRKHLYHKFVRSHRDCLCSLASLQRDESHALDGDEVCVVSLAFLVWRMSIEGIVNVERLRFHRPDNFQLRLMGPDERYDVSLASRLRWSYFGFFGIWSELSVRCGAQNFRVNIRGSHCDGHIKWDSLFERRQGSDNADSMAPQEFYVLYPDPSSLVENAINVCRERKKRGGNMKDVTCLEREGNWAWARYDSDLRDCMFQLRHPNSSLVRGQLWHVMV